MITPIFRSWSGGHFIVTHRDFVRLDVAEAERFGRSVAAIEGRVLGFVFAGVLLPLAGLMQGDVFEFANTLGVLGMTVPDPETLWYKN